MFFRIFGILVLVLAVQGSTPSWADEAAELKAGLTALGSKDYATAIRTLLPLAIEGNAEAQYQVGLIYHDGQGVPKDPCVSVVWMEKAARQSHPRAALMMGFTFFFGSGVRENLELAYRWASLAHKVGHPEAESQMFVFGHDLTPEQKSAIDRDMGAWDPSKLPPTDYFFFGANAIQPKKHYKETVERTQVHACR